MKNENPHTSDHSKVNVWTNNNSYKFEFLAFKYSNSYRDSD